MASNEHSQRDKLHAAIWKIADDVRGAVDGWDFKQFVLGTLFYRYLSEDFVHYMETQDYVTFQDDHPNLTKELREDTIKAKGYFIYPSQLFQNVAKDAVNNKELNTKLKEVFNAIEQSAQGTSSEQNIKGLFANFDVQSSNLGNTAEAKCKQLAKVIKGVESFDLGDFAKNGNDFFGDAYEFLISNYAANAGKSGGEFFTPQNVSKLVAQLALSGKDSVDKVYDPACGSGSLLLQVKNQFKGKGLKYFGQEINNTSYNLARMNMFLHSVEYNNFSIACGDTLLKPEYDNSDSEYGKETPFDIIVSNPPYSIKWVGDKDPTLINDDRFAPAGVLAPKGNADLAFVLHSLHYLSASGRAAVVCFPGIFYRGGKEEKIRKYLIDENYIEAVIALPPNLFFGTSIAVCILVLSKCKGNNTKTQFINASGEEFYAKATNNNVLTDEHIRRIVEIFETKPELEYVATSVEKEVIEANNYNLSVSSYLGIEYNKEREDINKLNEELIEVVAKIDELREQVSEIIKEIEQ